MWADDIAGLLVVGSVLLTGGWLVMADRWLRPSVADGHGRRANHHATPSARPESPTGAGRVLSRQEGPVDADRARGQTVPALDLGPVRRIALEQPKLQRRVPMRKGQPVVVPVRSDPLWKEKGWGQQGGSVLGRFQANGRSWPGVILTPFPGAFDAYIWNPPLQELTDRVPHHRPCFQRNGSEGRYRVHFHTMPTSMDHAIQAVEEVLSQATRVRGMKRAA